MSLEILTIRFVRRSTLIVPAFALTLLSCSCPPPEVYPETFAPFRKLGTASLEGRLDTMPERRQFVVTATVFPLVDEGVNCWFEMISPPNGPLLVTIPEAHWSTPIESDGTFRLDELVPGEYGLFVQLDYPALTKPFETPCYIVAQTVTVGPQARTRLGLKPIYPKSVTLRP